MTLYWYFVVGLIAAALMPYEIYFYSSGAVEEGWDESDLKVNKANAIVGFGLGGLISVALVVAVRAGAASRTRSPPRASAPSRWSRSRPTASLG